MTRPVVIALLVVNAWTAPAHAQRCATVLEGADAVGEIDATERIAFIDTRFRSGAEAARLWTGIYATSYLAITAGQLGAYALVLDEGERIDLSVGLFGSVVGVASFALFPLTVLHDEAHVHELARRDDRCDSLAEMERLLERAARSEADGVEWYVHVGNVAFNVGLGLALGLGWERWVSAAITTLSGIAIGELMIFTQPTDVVDALDAYRRGELRASSGVGWRPLLAVGPGGARAGLAIDF